MAIKNVPEQEVVSVFDPAVGAYREVGIEELRLQLESLGFTDDEIEEKIKKLKEVKNE